MTEIWNKVMVRCIGRMVSIIKDNGKMTYNMARPRPTILIWESRDAVLLYGRYCEWLQISIANNLKTPLNPSTSSSSSAGFHIIGSDSIWTVSWKVLRIHRIAHPSFLFGISTISLGGCSNPPNEPFSWVETGLSRSKFIGPALRLYYEAAI